MEFDHLPEKVVGLALNVNRGPGPAMLEAAYEHCFAGELEQDGTFYQKQLPMPVRPRNRNSRPQYRADLLINGKVIVELKGMNGCSQGL